MKLIEISKDKTPELFYSGQDTESGLWIETEQVECVAGTRLRKRCDGGWQDIELKYGVLKLYFLPEIEIVSEDETTSIAPGEEIQVADGQLIPQKIDWDLGDWVNMPFGIEHILSGISEDDYDAWSLFDNGTDSVRVDFSWRIGNSKQTYTIKSDVGTRVRMAAIVNDYKEPGIEVKQSFSDFLGLTLVETIADQEDLLSKKYVFESDGFELTEETSEFEIDPYIDLDELSTSLTVFCDGYVARVSDSPSYLIGILDKDDLSKLLYGGAAISAFGGTHYLSYDADRIFTLVKNTEAFVEIHVSGNFKALPSSEDFTPNSIGVTCIFTIYSDRVFLNLKWQTGPGNIDLDLSWFTTNIWAWSNSLSGGSVVHESSNAELESTYANYNSADYLGMLSDELNLTTTTLHHQEAGTATYRQTQWGTTYGPALGWNDGILTPGIHEMTLVAVFDSAAREGGKKYTLTERLAQGFQYTNPDLTYTTGVPVTNPAGVTHIDSGFSSDGAYHMTCVDGEAKYEMVNTEHGHISILEGFPIQSGDPDDPKDESGSTILPYGAYFTGNGTVDTSMAHRDILFYWDGSDCTSSNVHIGGVQGTLGPGNTGGIATFPQTGGIGDRPYFDNEVATGGTDNYQIMFPNIDNDIIDPSNCSVLVHFNMQTLQAYSAIFEYYVDGNNFILARLNATATNGIELLYEANGIRETVPPTAQSVVGINEDHVLRIKIDSEISLEIDGVEIGQQVVDGTWQGASGTMSFGGKFFAGADIFIKAAYITNNPNTPQIPTANGVPLHAPVRGDI